MKPKLDRTQHQELDNATSSLDGGEYGVFYDGAIDLERYSSSPLRILWLLKEAVGDYGADRYDNQLVDANIKNHSFCSTLRVIAYTSYGILMRKRLWSEIPGLYNGAAEVLREIAIINVKKTMGEVSSSNNRQIVRAFEENKALLQRQIDFYNPDILICGFPEACSGIVYDVVGQDIGHDNPKQIVQHIGDCAYFITPRKKILWHYHPGKPGNGETYVEEILASVTAK